MLKKPWTRANLWNCASGLLILFGVFWLLAWYAPGLHESFFNIDDADLIAIPQIRAPLNWTLVKTWLTRGVHYDLYPFRDFTYWVDVHVLSGDVAGADSIVFRLQNFFWFIVTALSLRSLGKLAGLNSLQSTSLAFIWMLLPMHSELLMWSSARKDCLALAFGALATDAFIRHAKEQSGWKWAALAFGCFFASLLSKASCVGLPFIIPAATLVLRDGFAWRPRIRTAWIPMAVLAIVYLGIQSGFYSDANDMRFFYEGSYRIRGALIGLGRYWAGLIFPSSFGVDVENWGAWADLNSSYLLPGAVAFVMLAIVSFWAIRRNHTLLTYGMLAFWAMYLPVCGLLFPHRNFYSVRYFELPLLALFLTGAVTLARVSSVWYARGALPIALLMMAQIPAEARTWDDGLSPFLKGLRSTPENPSLMRMAYDVLLGLKSQGRLTPELEAVYTDIKGSLVEKCGTPPAPESMINGHLCLGLWLQERFERATLDLPGESFSWAQASLLKVNKESHERLLLRDKIRSAENKAASPELAHLSRSSKLDPWQVSVSNRFDLWALNCLSGQTESASKLLRSWRDAYLMDLRAFAQLYSEYESKFPHSAMHLRRCNPVASEGLQWWSNQAARSAGWRARGTSEIEC